MSVMKNTSLLDGQIIQDGRWPYPSWFFSTARFNPGGPTWYGDQNYRVPAWLYAERTTIEVLTTFAIFFVLLLIILPIIKYRVNSAITALNAMVIGLTIMLCMLVPEWVSGGAVIESVMNHYTPQMYRMKVGVHVGLASFNVTLQYLADLPENTTAPFHRRPRVKTGKFWYNEIANSYYAEDLTNVMEDSLRQGMSTPVLSVFNFLASSNDGFAWPHRLGEAGFHCYIIMIFALLAWFGALLFTACIPRYSSYAFIVVGTLMVFTTFVYFYWAMVDAVFPCIVVENKFINLKYGMCFWACLGVGIWSIIYGFVIATVDIIQPDKFLTVFDIEYDSKRTLARAHRLNIFAALSFSPYRGD